MTVKRRKKPQGFKRLVALGEDRLKEIERLLLLGESALSVAEKIQKEWGEFGDVKQETLAKQIQRYRESHVDPHFAVASEKIDPERGKVLLARVEDNVDAMTELQELYMLQKSRVKKIVDKEENMPLLFNWLNGEIRTMKEILTSIMNVQMETGVIRRVPRTAAVLMAQTEGSNTKHANVLRESERVNDAIANATLEAMRDLGIFVNAAEGEPDVTVIEHGTDTETQ